MPLPLAAAIPAAAVAAAYLNARLGLSYDLELISAFARGSILATRAERRDRVSLFYDLEALAQSPKTRHSVFLLIPVRARAKTNSSSADHVTLVSYTYAEAYRHVLRHAAWLARVHRVRKGEVVALDMMNGERFVWVWFALWALGATPAFINYNLTGAALLHCVRVSTARLILVGAEDSLHAKYVDGGEVARGFEAGEADEGGKRVEVVRFGEALGSEIEREQEFRPEDEARNGKKLHEMGILIYTSGTTGLPKPAVVSWGKLKLGSKFVTTWLPLKKGDVVYTCMPLYHTSASLLGLLSALTAGTTLALGHRFSVSTFLPDVVATRATHLQYVGETLRYLLTLPPSPLDRQHSIHTIFGNGLRPDVWARFVDRFGIDTVAEFYAATEAPSGMWNKSRNGFSAGAVGRNGWLAEKVFAGCSRELVRLDDSTQAPVRGPDGRCVRARPGERGELLYALDPADISRRFQGYFNNAAATDGKVLRGVFAAGDAWFSTGDVLRRDDQRRWWFVDRLGDTFRWKSENVSTAEVAALLGQRADVVADVTVYGVEVPGEDGRAGCAAVVLLQNGSSSSQPQPQSQPPLSSNPPPPSSDAAALAHRDELDRLARLAVHAHAVLPKYAVPLFVRVTAALAVTGTNKLLKHVLQKDGIDPAAAERAGDRLYWLRDGRRYERFGEREWGLLKAGSVRL